MNLTNTIQKLASVDIFVEARKIDMFVGRPFYLDYEKAYILVADAWKKKVGGIPQGTFLLAFYDNEDDVSEALLLRVIKPTKLPTDNDVISSMVEYYKDNTLESSNRQNKLDEFTRYEFSFSGLDCRILGTFYKDKDSKTKFGADVENFYSSHNYTVFKAEGKVLELISNLRDSDGIPGGETDIRLGKVRYSSSLRFQEEISDVPVYVSPQDFLGKRTAMFGMTRTGKSNTVKKIIEATVDIGRMAKYRLGQDEQDPSDNLNPFMENGAPKYPVGQIVFDINGEYANANMQDQGTAIFEMYSKDVIRYSVLQKPGFKVMKVNFYTEITSGFELIRSHLGAETGDYVKSFLAVDLVPPEDINDHSAMVRYGRKKAAYLACLYSAGFKPSKGFTVKFEGNDQLNKLVQKDGKINPKTGVSLEQATNWFTKIWDCYSSEQFFKDYANQKGHEWADEDLKALLVFLTRKSKSGGSANVSGYRKLRGMLDLHTESSSKPFDEEIVNAIRDGKIIIVDLSQGDPEVQRLYSERVCQKIFFDSMNRFIKNTPNNFIQFYFEEAHNLFPKKDDKDLSQIYNRIAKEGAKLNLGMIYATQEVSSISSNILKNTQNWFIAHLNNDDELKELKKYYDFSDFTESLIRFSAGSDKGFTRMKTYSNPFVVPVQVDRFTARKEG